MSRAILRGGTLDVPRRLLTDAELEADEAALSCPNPDHANALRSGKVPFGIPERISSLIVTDDFVRYPVAAARVYRPRLVAKGLHVHDARPLFEAQPLAYRGSLFPFQRLAVDALLPRGCGGVVAPCGAGKTEIIAAAAGEIGLPTLVLESAKDLGREVRERLSSRLGVPVGFIGDGVHEFERITVAIVQALDPEVLTEIAPRFGMVVRDEGHHAAAPTERAVLAELQARRWYWLTATAARADGLTPFVHHHMGPVVYEVSRDDLVAAGRSQQPRYQQVATRFGYPYRDQKDWPKLLAALEKDEARNDLLASVVERDCAGELSALLLGRVAHVDHMVERLQARGVRAVALTGKLGKRARAAALDAARTGAADVVVGTQILDEGIDLPALSRVVLGWPSKSEARLVQRIGRALRIQEGKSEPVAIDIVDPNVGVLRNQARQRASIFSRAFAPGRAAAA
ncbi:MAG: DEAD/DEAH box helicase family protein [Labilithrix sp.]|nr:DEAD/DEAH box helicase family protein [Labilithrix sp.]